MHFAKNKYEQYKKKLHGSGRIHERYTSAKQFEAILRDLACGNYKITYTMSAL